MQVGTLVSIPGYSRKGVALRVSWADIKKGINARRPGVYIFSGYWYGTNPLSIASYGKIHGQIGKPIGKVKTHLQMVKLCR